MFQAVGVVLEQVVIIIFKIYFHSENFLLTIKKMSCGAKKIIADGHLPGSDESVQPEILM